jgi:hypothetical protein
MWQGMQLRSCAVTVTAILLLGGALSSGSGCSSGADEGSACSFTADAECVVTADECPQGCERDSDCVAVGEAHGCDYCGCESAAINRNALSAYLKQLSTVPGAPCNCLNPESATCCHGRCTYGPCSGGC